MSGEQISAPAGFVPEQAIIFAGPDGKAVVASAANPLPTAAPTSSPATSAPVTGSTTSSTTIGPFTPQLGRDILVTITMTGTGTAQLLSSLDGGVTKLPLTVGGQTWASYTGPVNEPAWTPTVTGQTFYLSLTASGGTTTGDMRQ